MIQIRTFPNVMKVNEFLYKLPEENFVSISYLPGEVNCFCVTYRLSVKRRRNNESDPNNY